jgi:glutamyl-tRNA reductase
VSADVDTSAGINRVAAISDDPSTPLLLIGLDHTTAPSELRERLSFTPDAIAAALPQLVGPAHGRGFQQAAILSTCSRVEVYCVTRDPDARAELIRFLSAYQGIDPQVLTGSLYERHGNSVARHLAATAAGMHSLVLGEAQIQGQVREALALAARAGTSGPELRRLFEAAVTAGRRVRTETALGRGIASVSHAAVELVRQRLGELHGRAVLVIGAGAVGELAAKHLRAHGAQLVVMSRDPTRARMVAARHGGTALTFSSLTEGLAAAEVVISSTGAPGTVLDVSDIKRALRVRAGRNGGQPSGLLLVDLAMPHDVARGVGVLPGVQLCRIDDIREITGRTLVRRAAELPAAQRTVEREVARFTRWLEARHAIAVEATLRAANPALSIPLPKERS